MTDYISSYDTFLKVVPGAPTGLYQSAVTSSGFTINWLGAANATSFSYRLTDSSGNISTITSTGHTRSYTFTSLYPSTSYSIQVSAVNGTGTTASSISVSYTHLTLPTNREV